MDKRTENVKKLESLMASYNGVEALKYMVAEWKFKDVPEVQNEVTHVISDILESLKEIYMELINERSSQERRSECCKEREDS